MHEAKPTLNRYGTRAKPVKIGDRFGRLTVIAEAPHGRNKLGHRVRQVLCRCDCGVEKIKEPRYLRAGYAKSCGCLPKELTAKRSRTHGATAGRQIHPLYSGWLKMRSRCRNPNDPHYEYYGGRGITICDRWFDHFMCFVEDMGPKPSPEYTVDRIDNSRGYSPDNCRWADKLTQAQNTRHNHILTVRGERMVLAEVARRAGVRESVIRQRIQRGWPTDTLDAPPTDPQESARRATNARWGR